MSHVFAFNLRQHDVDAWAKLSGDHNPLHVDVEASATGPFGRTVVHGHLTLAILQGALLRQAGTEWLHGGAVTGLRFRAPVFPGIDHRLEINLPEGGGVGRVRVVSLDTGAMCVEGTVVLRSGSSDTTARDSESETGTRSYSGEVDEVG